MHANHYLAGLLLCSSLAASARQTPLAFVQNKGQITDQYQHTRTDIDFKVSGGGVSLFVGSGQLHYQWSKPACGQQVTTYRMDVQLVGANAHPQMIAEQPLGSYEQYYLPHLGLSGTKAFSFGKVTYKDVYPHIDWVLYSKDGKVEYDFVVHEGGKVSDIRLQYGGATDVRLGTDGSLSAVTPMGSVSEQAPVSYAGGRLVSSIFSLQKDVLSFSVASYSGELTIDPVLNWSTYYGGSGDEALRNGCVSGDPYGGVYLAGNTTSTSNIATTGSYMATFSAGTDAFLVKFNSSGVRQWATYYGGTGTETVYGTACDPLGNVYLSGYTNSTSGISTSGAYQTALAGSTDGFLVKFDTSGVCLWGTYYGGSSVEQAYGVGCDLSGNVYLTGYTTSTSGISTTGSHQATSGGGSDVFLVKFNSSGVRQWATFYGGTGIDRALAVACDTARNVFITGYSASTASISTTGAFQTSNGGGQDMFLVKLDSSGVRQWATYMGGTGTDWGYSLVCDPMGAVYVGGSTTSTGGIAATGSFQSAYGGGVGDGFVCKFDGTGNRLWSSYYGGSGNEQVNSVAYSPLGYLYMAGTTQSDTGIAVAGTFQDTLNGGGDAFLVKLDSSGHRIWGTYVGGDASDIGMGVYASALSRVYVGGQTSSYSGLATSGSHQGSNAGGSYDGFLLQFNDCMLTRPDTVLGRDTVCRGGSYTYSVPAVAGAVAYSWSVPSGWSGSSTTNSISVVAGSSSDTIKVCAQFLCGSSTLRLKPVMVSALPVLSPSGSFGLCNGDSLVLSSSLGAGYQWLKNDTVVVGTVGSSLVAKVTGVYRVLVTSVLGCTDTSAADTLAVHPVPVPVITASGGVLSTGAFVSYQWNRNGVPVTGATGSSYTLVLPSGDYTVTVTDTNGCSATSTVYTPATGIATISGISLDIYPNPVTDVVYVVTSAATSEQLDVCITALDGREVARFHHTSACDVRHLADGLYILRVMDGSGRLVATSKIVKSAKR